jgi:hypothetical protein
MYVPCPPAVTRLPAWLTKYCVLSPDAVTQGPPLIASVGAGFAMAHSDRHLFVCDALRNDVCIFAQNDALTLVRRMGQARSTGPDVGVDPPADQLINPSAMAYCAD